MYGLSSSLKLIIALSTTGLFSYGLDGFLDDASDTPVDQMIYEQYPLRDCSFQQLGFTHLTVDGSVGQVTV